MRRSFKPLAVIPFQAEDSNEIESYDLSQDYFRFMFESGEEPTNNHSEQQIRHCVIDRRPFLLETRPKEPVAK